MLASKINTFFSEDLVQAVESGPCTCCGKEGMTIAFYIKNIAGDPIAAAKDSDLNCMGLCRPCYIKLDEIPDKQVRRQIENEYSLKTFRFLVAMGKLVVVK